MLRMEKLRPFKKDIFVNPVADKESDDGKKVFPGESLYVLHISLLMLHYSHLIVMCLPTGFTVTVSSVNADEMEKKKFYFTASNDKAIVMTTPTADSCLKKVQNQLIRVSYQAALTKNIYFY
jgi:hypothetical protein